MLERVFGFPALLEADLNHGVSHARRSGRSVDFVLGCLAGWLIGWLATFVYIALRWLCVWLVLLPACLCGCGAGRLAP